MTFFGKKPRFKLYEDQIVTNHNSERAYFMSSEAYEDLISLLIIGCRILILFYTYC